MKYEIGGHLMGRISYIDDIEEWRTDFSFKIPVNSSQRRICLDMLTTRFHLPILKKCEWTFLKAQV